MAPFVILHTSLLKVVFISPSASWLREIRFLFSFGTCLTFLNFSIERFERLTIISPFLTISQGSSLPDTRFQVHLSSNFERYHIRKWSEKRRLNQSPMIHWNQPMKESKYQIHQSSWHTRNPSICFCFLHPSSACLWICSCSPHCQHSSSFYLELPLPKLDLDLPFFFLYLLVFLSDRHSRHSLISQPTPMTSCAPLCWEEHPPHHQALRFLSYRNCSLSSRDHPRRLW